MNRLQRLILFRVAAFRSDVHQQNRLAGVSAERGRLAINIFERNFLNRSHIFGDERDCEQQRSE
jgi:hypothetical protein